MFLTTKPQTIEDFLKAVNFIAPRGYTLQYFITPQDIHSDNQNFNSDASYIPPRDSGFFPEEKDDTMNNISGTITYSKKNLANTHSFSNSAMNLGEIPAAMPRTLSTQEQAEEHLQAPLSGTGTVISSPVRKDLTNTHSFSPSTTPMSVNPAPMPRTVDVGVAAAQTPTYIQKSALANSMPSSQSLDAAAQNMTAQKQESIERDNDPDSKEIILKERYLGFPKYTLFHFVKD